MVGENKGHEVINLLKTEDDKFYIYLNSQGTMPNNTIEKCETNCPIDVLMVRRMNGKELVADITDKYLRRYNDFLEVLQCLSNELNNSL